MFAGRRLFEEEMLAMVGLFGSSLYLRDVWSRGMDGIQ
jgi:hypothetical protein